MASDPVLSRPQMITFCEKEANEWERFARLGCYKQDVTWPTTRAAMFRAIAQALQEDEPDAACVRCGNAAQLYGVCASCAKGASDAAIVPRLQALIADDSYAIQFQSMQQYRTALLKTSHELLAARVREGAK